MQRTVTRKRETHCPWTLRKSHMNRAVLLAILTIAVAGSATARERSFRFGDTTPLAPTGHSSLCTFKAPQLSGYRARAGERRICYYDCDGQSTAIVIRSGALCSDGQTRLVWNSDATAPSLERRPRGNGKLAVIDPTPPAE